MNRQELKVSVIICAYTMERLKDIHEAVNSILSQTLKPYEIIISVDHNQELYQRLEAESPPQVKVILNEGAQGLSETRNVGIRAATSEIVTFIDDDAIAEKGWLYHLTKHFDDPRVVAVGGRAVPLWLDGNRPPWFPEELDWIIGCTYKGLPLKGNEVRNVPGCNMAFRKDVFDRVGFWPSEIGAKGQSQKGGEEAELCLRIKHRIPDCLILYEPNAIIQHKVPRWRATLKWVFLHSFAEGACKAKVKSLSSKSFPKPLSTENSYLRYLLFTAILQRLRYFYKKGSLFQAGAIVISIAATGAGYLVGRVRT